MLKANRVRVTVKLVDRGWPPSQVSRPSLKFSYCVHWLPFRKAQSTINGEYYAILEMRQLRKAIKPKWPVKTDQRTHLFHECEPITPCRTKTSSYITLLYSPDLEPVKLNILCSPTWNMNTLTFLGNPKSCQFGPMNEWSSIFAVVAQFRGFTDLKKSLLWAITTLNCAKMHC